jgi:hypothetical protein
MSIHADRFERLVLGNLQELFRNGQAELLEYHRFFVLNPYDRGNRKTDHSLSREAC